MLVPMPSIGLVAPMLLISSSRTRASTWLSPPPPYAFGQVGALQPLAASRCFQSFSSALGSGRALIDSSKLSGGRPLSEVGWFSSSHARASARNASTSVPPKSAIAVRPLVAAASHFTPRRARSASATRATQRNCRRAGRLCLVQQVPALVQADQIALAGAGAEVTVHGGVTRLEEEAGRHLEDVGGPHIDHAAVAEDGDAAARVRRDDVLKCVDHGL